VTHTTLGDATFKESFPVQPLGMSTPYARRGLLYVLVAVAIGSIVVLRQLARGVGEVPVSVRIGGGPVAERLGVTLDAQTRYLILLEGDTAALAADVVPAVRVAHASTQAPLPVMRDRVPPAARTAGRAKRRVGSLLPTTDGVHSIVVEVPAEGTPWFDSVMVETAPPARGAAHSMGMLAVGGVIVLALLAIGGIVGRAALEQDAT